MTVGLVLLGWIPPANACGGYCSGQSTLVQSGERALFRQDGDEWTLFVEAQATGCAPNNTFTWVIPVHPPFDLETDVSLAPPGLFDALEMATAPRLPDPGALAAGGCQNACNSAVGAAVNEVLPDPDPSYLLGSATVGPFDLQLIDGGDPQILMDWLTDQGYLLPDNAREPIQYYIDQGEIFLAVQLNPTQTTGLIDTLELHCGMAEPVVPLGLTALAASEDMPMTAYVLGDARVVPSEPWTEVTPSLTGILDIGGYRQRMLEAQEEAGGRAFTVEYAAPAPDLLAHLDPEIAKVLGHGKYLTRYTAFIDPDEMDSDPVFVFDPSAPDISPLLPGLSVASAPPWLLGLMLMGLWRRRAAR